MHPILQMRKRGLFGDKHVASAVLMDLRRGHMARCPPSARTLSGHRWVFQGKTSTACSLARNGSLYSANSRPGLALQEALELGPAPPPFPTLAASTACGVRIFLSVPPCGTLSQLAGRALCSIQYLACRPSSSASGWGHCRDPCPKGAWWQGGGGRWKIPETSSPHTTCWGHHTAAGQPFSKAPWAGASPPWVSVVGAHLLDAMGSVIPRPAIWGSVASALFHDTLKHWRPSEAAPLSFPWPLVEKVWVTLGDPRRWLPLIGAQLVCPCRHAFSSGSGFTFEGGMPAPSAESPLQPLPLSRTLLQTLLS